MNPSPTPPESDPIVSQCAHARDIKTTDIRLRAALDGIRTGRWKAPVERVRAAFARNDKPAGDRLKARLPGIIFSGRFIQRADDALVEPSGVICLDFDHLPDPAEARAKVATIKNVIAAFISPSGTGLKVLVQSDAHDAASHKARYRETMERARADFALVGDAQPCNVSRLCFVSFDPDLYFNPRAMLYRDIEIESYRDRELDCHRSNLLSVASNESSSSTLTLSRARGISVEEIVTFTIPTCQGQRNRNIFDLARGLRYDLGMDRDPTILKPIVKRWHEKALPVIGTKPFDDTWADFQNAWDTAKQPLQGGNPVALAWEAVQSAPLPAACEAYDSEPVRRLLALCLKLGEMREVFMIPAHHAGELIGTDAMRAHRYLKMFVGDGHLDIIERGTKGPPGHRKATKYRLKP